MINKKTIINNLSIIALIGEFNTGKSLTLRKVIIRLLKDDAEIVYPPKYSKICNKQMIDLINTTERTKKGDVSDITVIFKLKDKKVLVTTYGDEWSGLLQKFSHAADIYVVAAHKEFTQKNRIKSLAKLTEKGLFVTIGRNYYNSTNIADADVLKKQLELQEIQADFIVKEINQLI